MINFITKKLAKHHIFSIINWEQVLFIFTLVFSISLRFFHFEEFIDNPHGWRQCDTANYIRDYYKNGVDFLHPSVCWMGGYKTLILEFPLTEALIAWLYQFFGPYVLIARLFFLFFYCVGVYFFYKNCILLVSQRIAMFSTVIYTFLPLSYYYSRALHIDFFALSFAFGMSYFYLVGIKDENVKKIFLGSLFATIAFLVKAPYALSFFFPIVYVVFKENKFLFCLRNALLFIFPVAVFAWWISKSGHINSLAPNWQFIPGYRKFDDNTKWYFGSFEHRFIGRSWHTLLDRLIGDLTSGFIGSGLLILGFFASIWRKKYVRLLLWFLGALTYLLLFFNLNIIHNYYQIPFIPLFSVFMAIGIDFLTSFFDFKRYKILISIVLTFLVCLSSIKYSENNFFKRELLYEDIAKCIEENTQENDLTLVSCGGLSVHCPIILYRAQRNGWSIPVNDLNKNILSKLSHEGCKYVAYYGKEIPINELGNFLKLFNVKEIPFPQGNRLFLFNLKQKRL